MKQIDITELLRRIEVKYITKAMKESKGSITGASRLLGMKRTTLYEKLKRSKVIVNDIKRVDTFLVREFKGNLE